MAYTLNYSGGTITVTDGTLNTASSSLSLPGRNYAGYGGPVDQNMVYLLENFAFYSSGPPNPLKGQTWYDTTVNQLKVNTGAFGSPNWIGLAINGGSPTFNNIVATGNITAAGTITGDYIVGNISITCGGNYIYSVQNSIAAAGTNISTAFQLSKDINVVTSVAGGTGVKLVNSSAGGNRIVVMNLTGSTVNVYPFATNIQINSLGLGAPYALGAGARLEFLSITATQWYTLNATYA